MKEFAINDEDYDDENDEDYEYNGGDMGLYDSQIDDVDELKTLRDTLIELSSTNPPLYARLLDGIGQGDKLTQFQTILSGVDGLIEQEANVTRQIQELEKAKKL